MLILMQKYKQSFPWSDSYKHQNESQTRKKSEEEESDEDLNFSSVIKETRKTNDLPNIEFVHYFHIFYISYRYLFYK